MSSAPSVERVTTLERLRQLEPQLEELFRRDPLATPFQAPAWWLPWVECFAPRGALRVLLVSAEGRPRACLPLLLTEAAGERTLRWIGDGISDRLAAIVDATASREVLALARSALRELLGEADRLELNELPSEAPERQLWTCLAEGRLEPDSVCPVLALDRSLPELESGLPRWLCRNLRQTEKRLAAAGAAAWRMASTADGPELLEAFIELHTARWRARGQAGVLSHPDVRAFHRAAGPRLLERGLLELEVLYLDRRPVAASYVLRRAHAHLYLFGFDPGLQRLSLGSLLIWRSISRASRAGLADYDFLRGQEPYKYDFGAHDRQSFRFLVERPAPGLSRASIQPRA